MTQTTDTTTNTGRADTVLATLATAPPEVSRAMTAANAMYETATTLVIDGPAMYQAAGADLVDLRSRWKAIEAQRVHLKEPFLEGGRRIDAFFKVPLDRLAEAADVVKSRMIEFKDEQDRIAAEAREKEEARIRAEQAELERQQAEAAERQRQARLEAEAAQAAADAAAAEAQAKSDAAQAKAKAEAAAARAAGDKAAADKADAEAAEARAKAEAEAEAARLEAEAVQARAQAEDLAAQQQADEAQAAMDLAAVAPPAPVVQSSAKASGVSGRKTWKIKTVDKRALVIAAGKAAEAGDDSMLAFLDVNESALNGIAKALKGAARVAGVVFGEFTGLAVRGR